MTKHFLSIHTVFILNENIKYLEEFIIYHKNLGVSHFYLYDNEGSNGRNGSTKTKTKYGFPISSTNLKPDLDMLSEIMKKYGDIVTIIKWQPKNTAGEIVYGWKDSVQHLIAYCESEWCAFIDLDEMIFSPSNIDLLDFIKNQPVNISCIKISQKKFNDRFLVTTQNFSQDFSCVDKVCGFGWASKNIVRVSDIINIHSMHIATVKNKTISVKPEILRFNHYNTNARVLSWMTGFYKQKTPFKIDGIDEGMSRYKHLFSN